MPSLTWSGLRLAVTYPKDNPLQILAGPGSGKTRVLTARVAYLVHYWGLKPYEITAVSYNQGPRLRNVLDIVLMFVSGLLRQVTFTNKAAQEMRKRLNVLLGPGTASRLILGKYHFFVVAPLG
jgi:DNA helicase-2/ATP-dependent DNA helicase PcrA